MQIREMISATQQSNATLFTELGNAFADGMDKLAHLNMEAARTILDTTREFSQQALSTQGPSEWLTLHNAFIAPAAGQIQDYNRRLLELAAATQATFARCTQAQVEEYGERTRALLKDFAKSAPQGSEPIVAAIDSAITAANQLYGSLQQTGQQAVEVAQTQ
ncbi:MAG TPA: TIGR01841 family phasin, partial [Candidatus Sulfotelmatobacter sp.]|nr:TIGR01841 family phasin [Candidatus Sulfotelmatobacter sp.]